MTHTPTSPARPEDASSAQTEAPLATSDAPAPDGYDAPEYYDPQEYRWVPVRRRPRHDGWTEEKQRRFIEALADTGLVSHAAKSVGMSRESANRLRRSAHGAAFARAWDAARQYAGGALEDIAFERAIQGVEHNVYDECGEVICTKRVYNDRLLTFLLRHLKPERYAQNASATPVPPASNLEMSLRAMEPQLPAPPEALMDTESLEDAYALADLADGIFPHFLSEQRPDEDAVRLLQEKCDAGLQRRLIAVGLATPKDPPRRRFR